MTLAEKGIQVNRSMIKKTFAARRVAYASQLALQNIQDLEKIVDWNIAHDMLLYRMSSDMFPWMSEYELADMPDIAAIRTVLARIGEQVRRHRLRLTFHPGPFNVLASPDEAVIGRTIKELRQHGEIMDMIGLPRSPFAKINIHLGGAYGNRTAAITRFNAQYTRLPDCVRTRLTVENDDKANMYSVGDLLKVHEVTGVPVVFDYHHHSFRTGDLLEEEAVDLAVSTWPRGITPVVHFSSSRKYYEDENASSASHADYIYDRFRDYGHDLDVMLEAKAKERAVLRFR